jgi:hypothetical protein
MEEEREERGHHRQGWPEGPPALCVREAGRGEPKKIDRECLLSASQGQFACSWQEDVVQAEPL